MFVTQKVGVVNAVSYSNTDAILEAIKRAHIFANPFAVPVLGNFPLVPKIESANCVIASAQSMGYSQLVSMKYLTQLAESHGYALIDPLMALALILKHKIPDGVHYFAFMTPILVKSRGYILTVGNSFESRSVHYVGAFPATLNDPPMYSAQVGFLMMEKQ